jgi:3D (Asp-Asp-Asp) domain-containing protein
MKNILMVTVILLGTALGFLSIVDYAQYGEYWQLTNDLSQQQTPHKVCEVCDIKSEEKAEKPKAIIIKNLGIREVSAYNPVKGQTDGNPCVGAKNIDVCAKLEAGENVCAFRGVPIGTKLRIADFGDCTVYDRTGLKYADRVDIMFPANMVGEALSFGVKHKLVSIIK